MIRIFIYSLQENALAQQKLEREDTSYSRGCLFCRQIITPTRAEFILHLNEQHNLQLGKSHNLVYIDELIDTIDKKMEKLVIYFFLNTVGFLFH